jgi:hypothetical protein
VATLASEIGILLWAGLLRPARVEGAVAGLEGLATPWGLRAAGAREAAARVRDGVLDAVRRIGRMPECHAVEPAGSGPAILPGANRTQAWTAGAVWALAAGWDGRPAMLL